MEERLREQRGNRLNAQRCKVVTVHHLGTNVGRVVLQSKPVESLKVGDVVTESARA